MQHFVIENGLLPNVFLSVTGNSNPHKYSLRVNEWETELGMKPILIWVGWLEKGAQAITGKRMSNN